MLNSVGSNAVGKRKRKKKMLFICKRSVVDDENRKGIQVWG